MSIALEAVIIRRKYFQWRCFVQRILSGSKSISDDFLFLEADKVFYLVVKIIGNRDSTLLDHETQHSKLLAVQQRSNINFKYRKNIKCNVQKVGIYTQKKKLKKL